MILIKRLVAHDNKLISDATTLLQSQFIEENSLLNEKVFNK